MVGRLRQPVTFAQATSKIDNAAVVQLQGDKAGFPLLSTLPNTGSSVFLTALKPCGILLPHVHQRATEIYTVLSGTLTLEMSAASGGRPPPCTMVHFHGAFSTCLALLTRLQRSAGTMTCGIAEENGGRQDLTFETKPGQAFVAPQGLITLKITNHKIQARDLNTSRL